MLLTEPFQLLLSFKDTSMNKILHWKVKRLEQCFFRKHNGTQLTKGINIFGLYVFQCSFLKDCCAFADELNDIGTCRHVWVKRTHFAPFLWCLHYRTVLIIISQLSSYSPLIKEKQKQRCPCLSCSVVVNVNMTVLTDISLGASGLKTKDYIVM